ncbi:MAG TPA: hypothetical protein VHD88_07230 [Pyrinomonadaceae bacterium]|nr:hypothetical protein [Pyrinomonadaceae bacterium]
MKTRAALCLIVCPLILFGSAVAATTDAPEENSPITFPSPDGRFALRISEAQDKQDGDSKIDIIETASSKVMADLGPIYFSQWAKTVLVWSADSKWVAYGTGGDRHRETTVYFWNGSAFEPIPLPDDLPGPEIKFHKGAGRDVKNYGGGVKPVRWLKSGELEVSNEEMMLSRVDSLTYTGTVLITIGFDAQHHASNKSVSKTKTSVE